ncbi:hypothetical protein ACQR1I_36225 [Bradyrhizobium sp. HKCCYLS2038]|uniref:hypothetical protein n=1 Tax=Bradyrhizobium sp. HKCCYLS2038 TaxID=3420764 RepID=UPI003EC06DA0
MTLPVWPWALFGAFVGLVIAYILVLRPVLRALPAFREFYAEADGFWAKVWALCFRSATIAMAYALAAPSIALEVFDRLAALLGDPELNAKQQILDALKDHPSLLSAAGLAMSAVIVIARLRSIGRVAG